MGDLTNESWMDTDGSVYVYDGGDDADDRAASEEPCRDISEDDV